MQLGEGLNFPKGAQLQKGTKPCRQRGRGEAFRSQRKRPCELPWAGPVPPSLRCAPHHLCPAHPPPCPLAGLPSHLRVPQRFGTPLTGPVQPPEQQRRLGEQLPQHRVWRQHVQVGPPERLTTDEPKRGHRPPRDGERRGRVGHCGPATVPPGAWLPGVFTRTCRT